MKSHGREHEPADDGAHVGETEPEAWAARVRAQRRAWLEGPTEDEKQAWAERERRRRARRAEQEDYDDDGSEGRRIAERWRRDLELVLAGLVGRIIEPPHALLGNLIREGRRHEDEFYYARRRRKRVLADDD
jgi:hypothetical protein